MPQNSAGSVFCKLCLLVNTTAFSSLAPLVRSRPVCLRLRTSTCTAFSENKNKFSFPACFGPDAPLQKFSTDSDDLVAAIEVAMPAYTSGYYAGKVASSVAAVKKLEEVTKELAEVKEAGVKVGGE